MLDPVLRRGTRRWLEPPAAFLAGAGVSPAALTLGGLVLGGAAGVLLYVSPGSRGALPVAALFIFLSGYLDGLDGAVARRVGATPRGDFLDHAADRYGDLALYGGLVLAAYAPVEVGVVALAGIFMTSYLGTQAQAVGLGRHYGGLLGRADRMALTAAAAVAAYLYPSPLGPWGLLGWLVVFLAVATHLTALQRFRAAWRGLGAKP
ncbi:MAG: CDP-alcohol phosphatidyltransferase family protein [Euryarchaeota archaeon]|nr:CDP-alcohol phosphatidyltransferase family protein [Euryarchaeota archaeon]